MQDDIDTVQMEKSAHELFKVGIKVPPFLPNRPALWFAQLEGQFCLAGITSDTTKFYNATSQLDPQFAIEVADIIENPPKDNKYQTLKTELIRRLSKPREEEIKQFLDNQELGTRKPSQFLRHLQHLAGPQCPFELVKVLGKNIEESWLIDTSVQTTIRAMKYSQYQYVDEDYRRGMLCEIRPGLGEYGVYRMDVGLCNLDPVVRPINSHILLFIIGCIMSIFIVLSLIKTVQKHINELKEEKNDKEQLTPSPVKKDNFKGIHLFRGILFNLLIFAITGGGGYPVFHRKWGGLLLGDCIFFMVSWSLGVSIPSIIDDGLKNGCTKWFVFGHIMKRSTILIFLGTVIDGTAMIPGFHEYNYSIALWCPLQRLGMAYLVVSAVCMLKTKKFQLNSKRFVCRILESFVTMVWSWLVLGILVATSVVAMLSYITFNCQGTEAEELKVLFSDNKTDFNVQCEGSYLKIFNKILIGESDDVRFMDSFYGFRGGLLGIITVVTYAMMGLITGAVLLHYENCSERLKLWSTWASFFAVTGVLITGVNYIIDFNLWPISTMFLLVAVCMVFYMILYMWNEKNTSKLFLVPGSTFVVLLAGHLIFALTLPFPWGMKFNNHILYLLENIWVVLLWYVVGYILRRNDIIIAF